MMTTTTTNQHSLVPPIKSLLLAFILLFAPQVFALDKVNTTYFGALAVEGYDTVAYFTENSAIKGSKHYQVKWRGANWRFSRVENLELFKSNPKKYAPQYGGYCAYAVSKNSSADIDPELFTIHKDKLYLSYNRSTNKKWLKDKEAYILNADNYWPQLIDKYTPL